MILHQGKEYHLTLTILAQSKSVTLSTRHMCQKGPNKKADEVLQTTIFHSYIVNFKKKLQTCLKPCKRCFQIFSPETPQKRGNTAYILAQNEGKEYLEL